MMSAVSSARRYVGQWWLPAEPGRTVGGVLDIDSDTGLRLELTDQLLPGGLNPVLAPIIHGHADGREVTLLDCMPANGGHTVIAQVITTTQVTRPRVALIGLHLADASDAVFDGLEVSITGLTPWAVSSGIQVSYVARPGSNDRFNMLLRWIEPVEATLPGPAPLTLSLNWYPKSSGLTGTADLHSRVYRVEERVALRMRSTTPQAWNGFTSSAVAVRDLMTVATQTPCRITQRTLLVATQAAQEFHRIDLYFKSGSRWPDREDQFRETEMVFTLQDFDFAHITQRWFALRDTIGMPLDVLLGLDYQPGGFYENRLFNAASAAEGFHAALFPNSTALPTQVHVALKKRVSNALAGLKKRLLNKVTSLIGELPTHERDKVVELVTGVKDPTQREWVMNRLGDNRPGLMARYLELATKADSEAVDALLTDVETWAGWLRDARNAIGHVNTGKLAEKVPDEDALYYLVTITRALLHLVVLAELGVSADTQRRLVDDEWNYAAERFRAAVRNHAQPP
jgi:hypothetical protein